MAPAEVPPKMTRDQKQGSERGTIMSSSEVQELTARFVSALRALVSQPQHAEYVLRHYRFLAEDGEAEEVQDDEARDIVNFLRRLAAEVTPRRQYEVAKLEPGHDGLLFQYYRNALMSDLRAKIRSGDADREHQELLETVRSEAHAG